MNKLIKLEKSKFGLDSYDISYLIEDKLFEGILISKERLDKTMEIQC